MGQRTEDQSGTFGFRVCHLGLGGIHVTGLVSLGERTGADESEIDKCLPSGTPSIIAWSSWHQESHVIEHINSSS